MSTDFKTLLPIVREFIKALRQRRTYSIRKNWYCFFGILWGIPIPIVTIAIDLYSSGLTPTLYHVVAIITSHPFQIFFLLHPLFFGIVFGAMGTVRYNKEQKIEDFEKKLIVKNRELESSNKKMQEVDRLKSNFLSMVSHELRTPLTTIQGYISFLRTEKAGTLNDTQKQHLKISEEESGLLNRMIEELLDLSKIESGKFKVSLSGIDMAKVIQKAVLSMRLFADNQGVALENNIPLDLPLVFADKERILQVVINLLENAIKFNQRGGRVYISASEAPENNKTIFCVSDTGIGMREDKLDRIFDKFYQGDSSRNRRYGGCGLGLAISKSILELHRGRIWAESAMGAGSKFFFELNKHG